MFKSFKNMFTSKPKDDQEGKEIEKNNSDELTEQDTAEKTAEDLEKEEEKMRFRLAMEIFKEEDPTKSFYEISLYNQAKMFESFFGEKLKNWKNSDLTDEFRPHYSNKKGGIDLQSNEIHSLLRSAGYEVIKLIGKKILNGDFNLTTVSFPIKVMLPKTILQTLSLSIFQMPIYLNLAGGQNNPVERMKYIITATIACFHNSSVFLKPLNPILGETYETMYDDGSKLFLEQTSHHPPISHHYMIGPNNNYKFYGYCNFGSNAGLNSLKILNKGKRTYKFNDGQTITSTFCYEYYNNSLIGTIRHESLGENIFIDKENDIECVLKYGEVKGKPSDFISGEIIMNKKVVSTISGSYLNCIEFDGLRYWDIRENIKTNILHLEKQLPSSSLYREDRINLEKGLKNEAQLSKEKLEIIQRNDRKLREKFLKNK